MRALATERSACTLKSDALQLTVHLRAIDVLPVAADDCEVVVLRRSNVPEHTAALAADELYVVLLLDCNDPCIPQRAVLGCGPDMLVNCLMPADMRVPDLFPLSLQQNGTSLPQLRSACTTRGAASWHTCTPSTWRAASWRARGDHQRWRTTRPRRVLTCAHQLPPTLTSSTRASGKSWAAL